jgi:hypothetical protein
MVLKFLGIYSVSIAHHIRRPGDQSDTERRTNRSEGTELVFLITLAPMFPNTSLSHTPPRHELKGFLEILIFQPREPGSYAFWVLSLSEREDRVDRFCPS